MNQLPNEIFCEIISHVYENNHYSYDIKFKELRQMRLVSKRFRDHVDLFFEIMKTRVGCMKFNTYTLEMESVSLFPLDRYLAFRKECDSDAYEKKKKGYWMAFSETPFCKGSEPIWELHTKEFFWHH